MNKIEAVPRAEAEHLYPELRGQKLWGEQASYDQKECAGIHYVVFGPIEPRALVEAHRLFKSVRVVNNGESV